MSMEVSEEAIDRGLRYAVRIVFAVSLVGLVWATVNLFLP